MKTRRSWSGPPGLSPKLKGAKLLLPFWSSSVLLLFSCHSEGWLQLRGRVVSAADQSALGDSEVFLRFHVSDAAWDQTCEDARAGADEFQLFRADETGRFDTGGRVYGGGAPGCSSCSRGVLCVGHAGFRTQRIRFDDCDDWKIASGEENS